MRLEVTVCNVCKDVSRETELFTVIRDSRSTELDLCAEHGAPLVELLALAETPRRHRAPRKPPKEVMTPAMPRSGRRGSTPIMTMEQIEAAKAAQ